MKLRYLLWILLLSSVALAGTQPKWPTVRPQTFTFHFRAAESNAFTTEVVSVSNEAIYRLECASAEGSKKLPTADDVWSGDVECHLQTTATEKYYYQSLLVAKADGAVSAGRAVFTAYELRGRCTSYPDWGLSRQFRLRGMRILLTLSNVVFQQYTEENHYSGIKSADVVVNITPDPRAKSEMAEPSRFEPPRIMNPYESDYNKYRVDCSHPKAQSK